MEIKSKAEFFRLWEAGVLGNRTRLWRRVEDAYESQVAEIGFREIRKPGTAGAGAWEKCLRDQLFETATRWVVAGRTFIMDDGVPNDKTVLQGEVCRTVRGLESYLVVGGPGLPPMRVTMARGEHRSYGYVATRYLLEKHMDPSSREDLDALLELYPAATVEFACFTVDVGSIPGRNTIFWETRNY